MSLMLRSRLISYPGRLNIPRLFGSTSNPVYPKPARRKITLPNNEEGHFKYDRDWSRDSRYTGQKLGDTPTRFMLRRLGHAYELYPILVLVGTCFVLVCCASYYSFTKLEVWLDRRGDQPPWAWERIRDSYWKQPSLLGDIGGKTQRRIELLEKLQDEMLIASKKRSAS
ncbi:hypothetical protein AB6A40_008667 [Gnathostoma spinigerum]|uniref:Uncharacterized protein n=1 Tax=Gnathostoma spinigerum TaxID=75299 RepID=A0ABD6EY06_9BILA